MKLKLKAKLSDLPKITQLVCDIARLQRHIWLQSQGSLVLNILVTSAHRENTFCSSWPHSKRISRKNYSMNYLPGHLEQPCETQFKKKVAESTASSFRLH